MHKGVREMWQRYLYSRALRPCPPIFMAHASPSSPKLMIRTTCTCQQLRLTPTALASCHAVPAVVPDAPSGTPSSDPTGEATTHRDTTTCNRVSVSASAVVLRDREAAPLIAAQSPQQNKRLPCPRCARMLTKQEYRAHRDECKARFQERKRQRGAQNE